MAKIDTQGMTGPRRGSGLLFAKNGKTPRQAGPLPQVKHKMIPDDGELRKEIKELIVETMHEVLDEYGLIKRDTFG